MEERASRAGWLKFGVAVLLPALALYAQSLGFGFLLFDDPDYTFACPFVKDGLSWANIREAFANYRHGGIYMPITWLSYQLTVTLFGGSAAAHHAVSLLLHLVNTLLVFKLFERFGLGRWSLLAALVWAIHPQRAEAVCWIASRKELLWSLFALLALNLTMKRNSSSIIHHSSSIIHHSSSFILHSSFFILHFFLVLLACLSKPTAMILPVLLIMLAIHRKNRIQSSSSVIHSSPPVHHSSFFILHSSFLLLVSIATGCLAIVSQTHPEGMAEKELFYAPLWERLLNAANAIGLYISQTLIPYGVHLDYRYVHGLPLHWYVGLPVFAIALIFMVWSVRRSSSSILHSSYSDIHYSLFIIHFSFFISLLPTLGIFGSFGEHARADRFLYLPSVFLIAALFSFVRSLLADSRRPSFFILHYSLFIILFLLSWPVVSAYRGDKEVFTRTLKYDAENPRALAHLGEAKCAAGELDAGIDMLRRSRAGRPSSAADARLAYALMRRGKAGDHDGILSIYCGTNGGSRPLDSQKALVAVGTAELVKGDLGSAERHLAAAAAWKGDGRTMRLQAEDPYLKLGYVYQNSGRHAEAVKVFERLVESAIPEIHERAASALDAVSETPEIRLFW